MTGPLSAAVGTTRRRAIWLHGCALGAWALIGVGAAQGQSANPKPEVNPSTATAAGSAGGLDLGSESSAPPAPGSQAGGLDLDVNPSAPVVAQPTARATLRDNLRDTMPTDVTGTTAEQPAPTVTPLPDSGPPAGVATGQQTTPEPLSLDHPTVVDTATLQAGSTTVALFGIEGVQGEMAQGLQGFLASTGPHVTCQAQTDIAFVCLQTDGTDVAQVALVNGAARARADAPDSYREQEAAAQTARRGIWASLPPPPSTVRHPVVSDTATLAADGQTYVLDGLQGLGAPFAGQLQAYIVQHGDSLTCDPQSTPGHYVCLLADGTDIAKVALVNGAARVAPDAPDSYRIQQADALNARRGFWQVQSQDVIIANMAVVQPTACCASVSGDDGFDGVAYVGGVPTAVIGGETVFLTYGGYAGWGYYDHFHHWRGAPDGYRRHMEHFHPYGNGLRGYRTEAAMHPGRSRPGDLAGVGGRPPGMAGPGGRPGVPVPAGRPGMAPGMVGPGGHPGMAGGYAGMTGPGGHLGGPGPGGFHPAAMGGGFIHPGPSASGFHPGGFHPGGAAPMARAAPPAMHASSGGGGGTKKH